MPAITRVFGSIDYVHQEKTRMAAVSLEANNATHALDELAFRLTRSNDNGQLRFGNINAFVENSRSADYRDFAISEVS